jgi:ubiquinone/menaquinone biosynthesis C-methylase UbiE
MLELARSKATARQLSAEFRLADAEHVGGADASFDLVIGRHLIWTLPDPPGALREWWRVLRPGGRLALVEGRWDTSGAGWRTRADQYVEIGDRLPLYGGATAVGLVDQLTAAGFVEVTVEPLMDARLWVEPPERDRFLVVGRRPDRGQ